MYNEIIEDYYISNGQELEASRIAEIAEQPTVYEVIRVIQGIPLFLEDHMERLQRSAETLDSDADGDIRQ